MRNCKQCNKEILITVKGLINFCCFPCKKDYLRNLLKNRHKLQQSSPNSLDTKSHSSPDMVTELPECLKLHPTQNLGLSRAKGNSFESFGGKGWYDMARKHCCNFEIREREGNCLTLCQPYILFTKPCNECDLGMALNLRHQ